MRENLRFRLSGDVRTGVVGWWDGSRAAPGEESMTHQTYTAIVEKEGDAYVALCPELDVASQGSTVEEATANLREAVELFLETADPSEVARRTHTDVFVTRFVATVG